ncbi:helix-turn-helix domain-containing protein [Cohnella cholangitidis]|uniref:Helix-turn-helix domain-containing protein n=1 Tax=Cohnella cholangitidis TaxID=2598458 RepID=A0A7G5C3D4_9BACL|nr:helix-turn-helix domain-containing protein [Cohnella cholangitidis]QMV43718.1 helix-turn-helix domain-containing protein [Cohnella cholangitidis]
MEQIGMLLKKCRERKGWSQEFLAERLNYSRSSISKIEKDRKGIDFQVAIQWFRETGAQDAAYAIISGTDVISIIQNIFDMGTGIMNLLLLVA